MASFIAPTIFCLLYEASVVISPTWLNPRFKAFTTFTVPGLTSRAFVTLDIKSVNGPIISEAGSGVIEDVDFVIPSIDKERG